MSNLNDELIIAVDNNDIATLRLTPEHTPVAFKAKQEELMNRHEWNEKYTANYIENSPIILRVIYDKKRKAAFLVDEEMLRHNMIYNPFDGKEISNFHLSPPLKRTPPVSDATKAKPVTVADSIKTIEELERLLPVFKDGSGYNQSDKDNIQMAIEYLEVSRKRLLNIGIPEEDQ